MRSSKDKLKNKQFDYPRSNKHTQAFRGHIDGKHRRSDREDAYGGKLQQRESDVSYIVDNQVAGIPDDLEERRKSSQGPGVARKK
ncbi:MAG: hypothetical protein WC635_11115 [Bacteriovorax sp.]